jgi:hypothetical protein
MVGFLRTAGHDVVYVAEAAAGLSDLDVVTLASPRRRITPSANPPYAVRLRRDLSNRIRLMLPVQSGPQK